MKIVHIITRLIVGGAQENTLLSCEGQAHRGHDVTLITGPSLGPEGSLMDRTQGRGYRVIVVDEMRRAIHPIRDWRTYRQLISLLRELRPDIVHAHSSKAGILGRRAAKAAGISGVVHTIHGLAFTASTNAMVNAAYRRLEKWAAPMTAKIVCVADAMREQSLAGGVGRPEQYVTVYSGMETAPFLSPPVPREATRQALGAKPGDVLVGTIARLFHLKGHDDLLALAPDLCRQFPQLRFLWVGDGLLRGQFEQKIRELNLTDRFIFTGLVSPQRVPELCCAMDVVVHPSRREGLARAIAQGQLAGCPVIAYDIDGNREGMIDGQSGFLLPPFDVAALGRRLAELLENPDRARQMGQAGRAFAAERFDAGKMVEELEKVYQTIRS